MKEENMCTHTHKKVKSSRKQENNSIVRIYYCDNCDDEWTTVECDLHAYYKYKRAYDSSQTSAVNSPWRQPNDV